MSRLDSFRTTTETEKAKTQKQATPAPEGHSVADFIHGDKKISHAFFEFLVKSGAKDLAERVHKGELNAGDTKLLEKKRAIFSEKITQVEKIEAFITPQNIDGLTLNNPDFAALVRVHSAEGQSDKVMKAIQSQLLEISVSDESRFKKIVSALGNLESYKNGTFKAIDEKVEKLCKDNKITEDEYYAVIKMKDPAEKDKAMKALANRTYGGFKKTLNWLSYGHLATEGKGNLKDLQDNEAFVKYSFEQFDVHQTNIGAALFASLDKNKSMRDALSRELIGGDAEQEPQVGFAESKVPAIDERKLKADWEAEKKKPAYRNQQVQATKMGLRNNFIAEQKTKIAAEIAKKGSSFLIDLLASITALFLDEKLEELPL